MDNILKKLEEYIGKYAASAVQLYFDLDDDGSLASNEVYIWSGDMMCPHKHRYDPKTGHGYHEVEEDWQKGDRGLDSLNRALDKLKELSTADYECEECEEIRKKRDSA